MATGRQGDVCGYEPDRAGVGDLESQWDGLVADDEVGLACVGEGEGAAGAGGVRFLGRASCRLCTIPLLPLKVWLFK